VIVLSNSSVRVEYAVVVRDDERVLSTSSVLVEDAMEVVVEIDVVVLITSIMVNEV